EAAKGGCHRPRARRGGRGRARERRGGRGPRRQDQRGAGAARRPVMRRWARRLGAALAVVLARLALSAVVTARSGDPSLYPAPPGGRVAVFVVNHGYHAGIIVPRAQLAAVAGANHHAALVAVAARFSPYAWLEIG